MKYAKKYHANQLLQRNIFVFDKKPTCLKPKRKPEHGNNSNNNEGCIYDLGNRSVITNRTVNDFGTEAIQTRENIRIRGNYGYEDNYDDDGDNYENRIRIKFTRKFTHQYRNFCCILSSLLLSLLSASIVFYCGYQFLKLEPGEELLFHGSFIVVQDDELYHSPAYNVSAGKLETKFSYYINVIETALMDHPLFRLSLLSTEILAVDGDNGEQNITVHFELKFNPRLLPRSSLKDLVSVLKRNLHVSSGVLDTSSISLHEVYSSSMISSSYIPSYYDHISKDNFSDSYRICVSASRLPFCSNISNNSLTAYPNIFMHKNTEDIQQDLIIFRELIDSECFQYTGDFLCDVLQPSCTQHTDLSSDETFLPCRAFCNEFLNNCGDRFSERLKKSLNCSKFPEYSNFGRNCRTQPNCNAATLKNDNTFSYRLCDGVIDCIELEDEISCPYCFIKDAIHCGLNKKCIPKTSRCDDVMDCPDGSDEENCLLLSPEVVLDFKYRTVLDIFNYEKGYLIYTNEGTVANVCIDDEYANNDLFTKLISQKIGKSLCNSLSYTNVINVETKLMIPKTSLHSKTYANLKYNVDSDTFLFLLNSTCSSNRGLYVTCNNVECGLKTTKPYGNNIDNLNKIATAGDWPWHVALFKNGVHSCDATLVSQHWLLTTISCFQGQNKAEWIAKLGIVRLYGKSPWQQERRIVGMVNSPVEGSTLVLLKLSNPVIYSHFVRPICLPVNQSPTTDLTYCNTLGWTKTKKILQRIEVKEVSMDNCSDISITTNNGLCAKSTFETNECNEEEMSGSAMFCLTLKQKKWTLVGISNWRMSCSLTGMQRPRLYDKVQININWILNLIQEMP